MFLALHSHSRLLEAISLLSGVRHGTSCFHSLSWMSSVVAGLLAPCPCSCHADAYVCMSLILGLVAKIGSSV